MATLASSPRICTRTSRLLKSVDGKRLSVEAALTFPGEDLDGDVIAPHGGDWSEPDYWVGLEHLRWHKSVSNKWGKIGAPNISERPVVIGWARESLQEPGGSHSVVMKSVNLAGTKYTLPFGTTYFDPSDRLSWQVFRLIADDVMTGASLELVPTLKKSRGFPCPLNPARDALEVPAWIGKTWVHCMEPVNPGARTVIEDAVTPILQKGRLGSELLHPVLAGLMSTLARPSDHKTSTVTSGYRSNKAMPFPKSDDDAEDDTDDVEEPSEVEEPAGDADSMDDSVPGSNTGEGDDLGAEDVGDAELGDGEEMPEGSSLKPTPEAGLTAVQSIYDAVANVTAMLEKAEHPEGVQRIQDCLDKLKAEADELLADLQELFPDAGLDAPDGMSGDDDEAPLPQSDDGAMLTKAYPGGFPIRFKRSELAAEQEPPTLDPSLLKSLKREIAREQIRTRALVNQVTRTVKAGLAFRGA